MNFHVKCLDLQSGCKTRTGNFTDMLVNNLIVLELHSSLRGGGRGLEEVANTHSLNRDRARAVIAKAVTEKFGFEKS